MAKVSSNMDEIRAESNALTVCEYCGTPDNLLLCAACKEAWYCCKDHQKLHWKVHKIECKKKSAQKVPIPGIQTGTNSLNVNLPREEGFDFGISEFNSYKESSSFFEATEQNWSTMPPNFESKADDQADKKITKMVPNKSQPAGASNLQSHQREVKIADYVIKCLNDYGICVVDNFMGTEKCEQIVQEVKCLEQSGVMQDGQLTSKINAGSKVRGDKITWVEKGDQGCPNISSLIHRLDSLILTCNGKLGMYTINGRTKSMVACYPGNGTHYMRHVDNPHEDGRCITSIYYINKNWDIGKDGGLLRIFPTKFNQVADIEPKCDRLLFFWSDRRNPHEVQPAYRSRYAITVWYFDAEERLRAKLKHQTQLDDHSFNNNGPPNRLL